MTPRTPAQAFATVAAALVDHGDVADTLSRLLTTCAELLDVSAAAVLVRDPSGDLQLLSSTSHKVAELELYQVQSESPASTASVPGRRSRGYRSRSSPPGGGMWGGGSAPRDSQPCTQRLCAGAVNRSAG